MTQEISFSQHPAFPAITIVTLKGHITGGPQAVEFSTHINKLVATGTRHLVADLSGIQLINSSGLGMLVGGLTTLRKNGGVMRFAATPANVMNLLEMTRLNTVFEMYDSVDAAVAKVVK
ncbi:MAG: anti-sigma factor antagonist [Candidatus Kapaibacterium sp.]|nr:MAG: anti-sigma factor antagonist [Candidatus Kapabacteria bacterium]